MRTSSTIPPGKIAGVYSYNGGASAFFMFRSPRLSFDHHNSDQQKTLLADFFDSVARSGCPPGPATESPWYEAAHRPLVRKAQRGVTLSAALLAPATRSAIWRRNQLTRLLPLIRPRS